MGRLLNWRQIMPQNIVNVTDAKDGISSITNGSPSTAEGPLTPEKKDALITRAKDIIAGRIHPEPLPVPQYILDFFEREFAGYDPPPTPEAIRFQTDRLSLEAHYKGQPVAVFKTVDGVQAVLAVGEPEIGALFEGLSDEEESKVIITDTLSG
jgi:hypothetical protein